MKKIKSRRGMTMAELLIVVAIIAVLGGLSFVAVWNYQRSLGQLERDGIAKEIFVAAQNHLTAAYGEGYLGLETSENEFYKNASDGTSYIVVNSAYFAANDNTIPEDTMLGMMLPFGSIDDTVRIGGSYLIHYQPATGLMLDVFYCTRSGSPEQFNHELGTVESVEKEYEIVMDLKGEDKKSARRTYVQGGRSILGWYGGDDAALLPKATLEQPTIVIKNEEKLYVEVTNPNSESVVTGPDGNPVSVNPKLQLIVTGVVSGAQKSFELKLTGTDDRVKWNNDYYSVILDDITAADMHFADIVADTIGENFIPGEDLEIQAVAYSNDVLSNVAYSAKGTTNSLFGSTNNAKDTAYIGNIRHLENLDKAISNLDANDGTGDDQKIKIAKAEQTDSFSWKTFRENIRKIESTTSGVTAGDSGTVCVYPFDGSATKPGFYLPISPDYELSYDGRSHSISDVAAADKDAGNSILADAGLFGKIADSTVKEIKNLELIDFTIAGTASAGALAGTIENSECVVSNVLARNLTNAPEVNVTALTAGGLIGSMNGTIEYSAASLIVGGSTTTTAGGLAGTASGTITGCYSGGHTTDGSYKAWVSASGHSYDVTASATGAAGGLVGTYLGKKIESSYSTCSVYGDTAGGFVGITDTQSKTIQNCYAAGLVDGTQKYAFLASGTATLTGNYYFSVVNEIQKAGGWEGEFELLAPCVNDVASTEIQPLDLNAQTYDAFVGESDDWGLAKAYDPALVQYYGGKYCLKNVEELGASLPAGSFVSTHYGDWPAPEVFTINK